MSVRTSPHSTAQSTAVRVLSMPVSGMEHLTLAQGQNLELAFEPDSATFARSGDDLIITGDNGAGLTLDGFFAAENAADLPQIILPGGDTMPAAGFLQSLHIDIGTEAGPEAVPRLSSSGEGEYADGAGDLIGGLDRLGSLGADQWAGAARTVAMHPTAGRSAAGPDNGPDGPPTPPTPKEPPIFNARAVLYMQNEGDAPDGEPYTERGVTIQALAKNSDGQWEASGRAAASIQPHKGNELDVDRLIAFTTDDEGNITFRLTAAGKAWSAAHSGTDMVAYYTLTDASGNSYVIQVVISADGTFDSSSEHNENLDPSGLIHGEWHDGKDLSQQTGYKTTSSNLGDRLTFSGMVTGADIKTGYAADSDDWGKDTVVLNGSLNTTLKETSTPIYTDAGDPSLQTGTRIVHSEKSGNNVIETGREGTVTINYTAKTGDGSGAAVRAVTAEDGTSYHRGYQPGSSAHVTDETYSYSNTITSGGITIKADGGATGSAVGVYGTGVAGREGGNTLIALNGDIGITAGLTQNRGEALGVGSRDADSIFKASRDVSIEAKAAGGTGSATAVSWIMSSDASHVDKEYSIKAGRDVNLTATNGYEAGGLIVRASGHYGVVQATGDADNPQVLVEAGNNVNITAVSHGGTGNLVGAVGVGAEQTGGVTTVIRAVEGNITVDAQAGSGGAVGVSNTGYGGYTGLFLEAKNGTVDISATNTGSRYGKVTGLVTGGGNSNVDVDGNRQCDANATSVTAKNINIRATDNSGLGETAALAASGGRNELSATGDGQNLFSATGGKTGYGLFAQGTEGGPGSHKGGIPGAPGSEGINSITALNGEVKVEASGDTAYGTSARGGRAGTDGWVAPDTLVGGTGGQASNNITAKNVTIAATAVDAAYGLYTQAGDTGLVSTGKGGAAATTITAKESVSITASGDKAWGVFAKGSDASNTIKSDAHLTVAAEGKTLAQGAAAQGDGALTELSSLNRLDITAKTTGPGTGRDASAQGAEGAFGLYAANGGNVGAEAKDLHITATAEGNRWAVGARAEKGGGVELTGAKIAVKATVEAVDKAAGSSLRAVALETNNGDITVNMTGHGRNTLLLEAENKLPAGKGGVNDFAAGIFAEGKSKVAIQGGTNDTNVITIKTVTDAAGSAGIYTSGKDADVSILGGDHFDDVTIDAASNTGEAMGIHVSKTSSDVLIDTGKGGDLVTIRARSSETSGKTYSHAYGLRNMGGTITVKSLEGSVDIGTFSNKSNSYAVSAAGPTAVNSVEARRVDLKAESNEGAARGIHAQQCATNHVSGSESVTVEAQGGTADGLHAGTGASNYVTGRDVGITATGTNSAAGLYAAGVGTLNSVSAHKAVKITATGGMSVHGVSALEGASNSLWSDSLTITAETAPEGANAYGISALYNGASNTITTIGSSVITAEGGASAYGILARHEATNSIAAGSLDITATGKAGAAFGVLAESADAANIVSTGTLNITATGSSNASGILARGDSVSNRITAADTTITVTGGIADTHGVDAIGSDAANSLAVTGDLDITVKGKVNADGIGAGGRDTSNTITATGRIGVSVAGRYATGIGAGNGGRNEMTAKDVRIAASTVGFTEAHTFAQGMHAQYGGRNDVADCGNVDISATADRASSSTSLTFGLGAQNKGSNSITAKGDADITASGGYQNIGILAESGGVNSITAERVNILAKGGVFAYGMSASVSGVNLIENTGKVEITAQGTEKSYAMYAADGGVNTIAGTNGNALIVIIKAAGGSLGNYAMFAGKNGRNEILGGAGNDVISLKGDIHTNATGKNIVDTGAGDDRIELDGKVTGNFSLDAGDGHDTLVLRASSWAEFTDRYQIWLKANFGTMNVEAIRWAGPAGDAPEWLHKLVQDHNFDHPDAPIDLAPASAEDLAHVAAGGAAGVADPAHKAPAPPMTEHTGREQGQDASDDDRPYPAGRGDDRPHDPADQGNDGHTHAPAGHDDNSDVLFSAGQAGPHLDGKVAELLAGYDDDHGLAGDLFGGVLDFAPGHGRHAAAFAPHDGVIRPGTGGDFHLPGGLIADFPENVAGHGLPRPHPIDPADGGALAGEGLDLSEAPAHVEVLHVNFSGGDPRELDILLDSLREPDGDGREAAYESGHAGPNHAESLIPLDAGLESQAAWNVWAGAGSEEEKAALLIQNGLS